MGARVAGAGADAAEERQHAAGRPSAIAPRTVGLRVFAVATPGGWRVMPGGLARVAGDERSRVIAMQRAAARRTRGSCPIGR